MAGHNTFDINATTYVIVTSNDVTAARVQNTSGVPIWIQAAATTTAPTSDLGAVLLLPYSTFAADYTLAQIFPGVTGAARLFAKTNSAGVGGQVSVSHA